MAHQWGRDRDGLAEVLGEVVAQVGLRQGAVHAEFRMGGGSPVLIDLASRSIGGRCSSVLRFRSGSTLEELVIRAALADGGFADLPRNAPAAPAGTRLHSPAIQRCSTSESARARR